MAKRSTSPEAIARRNAAFAKLEPAAKRVVVAKDVITSLNAKRLKAKANIYLNAWPKYDRMEAFKGLRSYSDEWYARAASFSESDAQTALLNQQLSCEACAIGSVFVCAVERMDRLTVDEFKSLRQAGIREYLGDLFSPEQLDLMETAFERTTEYVQSRRYNPGKYSDSVYDPSEDAAAELDQAVDFGNNFAREGYADDDEVDFDADGCMRAIMQNIIDNAGEFKP